MESPPSPKAAPVASQYRCGKCRQMDYPVECVCCRNTPCVITSDLFYDICLNSHFLSDGIINHSDFFGEDQEFTPVIYRKIAYRLYIMYQLATWEGLIERSFLSCMVRDNFPAPAPIQVLKSTVQLACGCCCRENSFSEYYKIYVLLLKSLKL